MTSEDFIGCSNSIRSFLFKMLCFYVAAFILTCSAFRPLSGASLNVTSSRLLSNSPCYLDSNCAVGEVCWVSSGKCVRLPPPVPPSSYLNYPQGTNCFVRGNARQNGTCISLEGQTCSLTCQPDATISVTRASFGFISGSCSGWEDHAECYRDALPKLSCAGTTCDIKVDPRTLGDGCVGRNKQFAVSWSCNPKPMRSPLSLGSDADILCDFYRTLSEVSKSKLNNWCTSSSACSPLPWTGVGCAVFGAAERVVSINLVNMGLDGYLPSSLGGLDALKSVIMDENALHGPLPPALGSLKNLQTLSFSKNQLTSTLPPELGRLNRLVDFWLENNKFSGSIPSSLGGMTSVQNMFVGSNAFTGKVPTTFGLLVRLEKLRMDWNSLTYFPLENLGNLKALLYLNYGGNRIVGSISSIVGRLNSLQFLIIGTNQIGGTLPTQLGSLTNLKEFIADTCSLTGTIPAIFGRNINLKIVALNNNMLTGPVPADICVGRSVSINIATNNLLDCLMKKCSAETRLEIDSNLYQCTNSRQSHRIRPPTYQMMALEDLYAQGGKQGYWSFYLQPPGSFSGWNFDRTSDGTYIHNPCIENWYGLFRGGRPSDDAEACKLETTDDGFYYYTIGVLALWGSNIQGSIPSTLYYLEDLWSLNFGGNPIHGSIPHTIALMTDLEGLWLQYSGTITGPLPPMLGSNQPWLRDVTIFYTQINGTLPASLGLATRLTNLGLFSNKLSGSIPSSFTALTLLQNFLVESNRMTGTLYPMRSMSSLKMVRLGNNRFVGTLPQEIFSFNQLQTFWAFNNSISGSIPSNVSMPAILDIFLQDNRITGSIPSKLFMQPLKHLKLANNLLMGSLPDVPMPHLHQLNVRNNTLSGGLPAALGLFESIFELDVSLNRITGTIPSPLNLSVNAYLDLSNNLIEGTVPSLELISGLSFLGLANNSLTSFSDYWYAYNSSVKARHLRSIDISRNKLRGLLPVIFDKFLSLENLDLSYNDLTGVLSPSIAKLRRLQTLILSHNNLNAGGWQFFNPIEQRKLVTIDLSSNAITGSISPAIFDLPGLKTLGLARNCMTGILTQNICHATQLETIILNALSAGPACLQYRKTQPNSLGLNAIYTTSKMSGSIPMCVFLLPHLRKLYLAGNGFSGSLPVVTTSNLTDLVLSYNALAGTIPKWIELRPWRTLELSNNRISGTISSNFCATNESSIALSVNRISGMLPASFSLVPTLTVLEGNLFDCASSKFSQSDPYTKQFASNCGSSAFDTGLESWACALSATIILLFFAHYGIAAAATLFVLWLLTSVGTLYVVYRSCMSSSLVRKHRSSLSALPNSYFALVVTVLRALLILTTNFLVVASVNVACVYVSLKGDNLAQSRAKIWMSMFKIVWTPIILPYLLKLRSLSCGYAVSEMYGLNEQILGSWAGLPLLCALFNNIVIPCLATSFTDPECFRSLLIQNQQTSLAYSIPEKLTYLVTTTQISEYNGQITGNSLTNSTIASTLYFHESYSPNSVYSHECTTIMVASYTPVFLNVATFAFIQIAVKVALHIFALHVEHHKLWIKIWLIKTLLPAFLFPKDVTTSDEQQKKLENDLRFEFVATTSDIIVIFTFGLANPVLGATFISSTISRLWAFRSFWIYWAASEGAKLDLLESACVNSNVSSNRSIWVAIIFTVVSSPPFLSLFLFDMTQGSSGGLALVVLLSFIPAIGALAVLAAEQFGLGNRNRQGGTHELGIELQRSGIASASDCTLAQRDSLRISSQQQPGEDFTFRDSFPTANESFPAPGAEKGYQMNPLTICRNPSPVTALAPSHPFRPNHEALENAL